MISPQKLTNIGNERRQLSSFSISSQNGGIQAVDKLRASVDNEAEMFSPLKRKNP